MNPRYQYLCNSYYEGAGPQFARADRGHLSRPTVSEVYSYRKRIDQAMLELIETTAPQELAHIGLLSVLGVNHEQQP